MATQIQTADISYCTIKPGDKGEAVQLLMESFADNHLFKHFFKEKSAPKARNFFDILIGAYMRIDGVQGVYTPEGELVSVAISETDRDVVLNFKEKMSFLFRLGFFPAIRLISYTLKSYQEIYELKDRHRYLAFVCIKKEHRSRQFTAAMFAELIKGHTGLIAETSALVNARTSSWYGFKIARTKEINKIPTYFLLKTDC